MNTNHELPRASAYGFPAGRDRHDTQPGAIVCTAFLCVVTILALSNTVRAQQVNQDTKSVKISGPEMLTAPVMLDGQELFRVRGVSAFPAEERARVTASRIEALAADYSVPLKEIQIVEAGEQTNIQAGSLVIASIVDADASLEGVSRPILSGVILKKIQVAVQQYRYARSPRVLLIYGIYAGGATVLMVGILILITWLFRRLDRAIESRYRARIQGVRIQAFQLVQAEQIWLGVRGAFRTLRALAVLTVFLVYAEYVLSLFPWTRPLAMRGLALLLDPLRTMASALLNALPNLVFIAVLVLVVRYLIKLVRLLFSGVSQGAITIAGFDSEWALPTYKLVRLLVIAFSLVVAYPYIPGAGSEAFKGVSIFIGVMVSLGSSSALSNIIAGYALTYRRAFRVGDRIQISELIGDVAEIRLQVTHLRSLKNEEIIIPNSQILNSHVINYSKLAQRPGLILHTTVGIGYETPWRQVEAMLLVAAERTPGLLREPPPFVRQKELGDFCVTYEINVYSDRPQESVKLYTELHRNILDLFNEYGVQIMTPAYVGDPELAKVVPREKWFDAPAQPVSKNESPALQRE